jgi:hypothetical protein
MCAFSWNNNCIIVNMHGKTTIKKVLKNFVYRHYTSGCGSYGNRGVQNGEHYESHKMQLRYLVFFYCKYNFVYKQKKYLSFSFPTFIFPLASLLCISSIHVYPFKFLYPFLPTTLKLSLLHAL